MDRENENLPCAGDFSRWQPAAWLRVFGVDAFTFLQGQLTNDLRGSATGAEGADSVYGLWLNHRGRVLADSFVLRAGEEAFWVGSYFSPAAMIRERLEAYIVADDVTIEDVTEQWSGVTRFGAGSGEAEKVPDGLVEFRGRRGGNGAATEWVFPKEKETSVWATCAGKREIDATAMERARIAAGIPAVPADIGPNDLPNEGGLERDAISYTKGCYLGQEVMARLKSMGQVRRRLMRVHGAGAAPNAPAELFQEGRKIGELRSVVAHGDTFIGLAMITLLNFQAERPLAFSAARGETRELRLLA